MLGKFVRDQVLSASVMVVFRAAKITRDTHRLSVLRSQAQTQIPKKRKSLIERAARRGSQSLRKFKSANAFCIIGRILLSRDGGALSIHADALRYKAHLPKHVCILGFSIFVSIAFELEEKWQNEEKHRNSPKRALPVLIFKEKPVPK